MGNSVEVIEAIDTLRGKGPADLKEVVFALGGQMLQLAGRAESQSEAEKLMQEVIDNGKALEKFAEFVRAQGGDPAPVYDTGLFEKAPYTMAVAAPKSGYVDRILAEEIGIACMTLGGGRETKESVIDLSVGILLEKKNGDRVETGDTLAVICGRDKEKMEAARARILGAYEFSDAPKAKKPVVKQFILP